MKRKNDKIKKPTEKEVKKNDVNSAPAEKKRLNKTLLISIIAAVAVIASIVLIVILCRKNLFLNYCVLN